MRIVSIQLTEFFEGFKALQQMQSAYREQQVTESALLRVYSHIYEALDDGNVYLLGLIDLSAAFHTVDHNILLTRFEDTFGVSGRALKWLQSYLSEPSQMMIMNSSSSG